MQLLFLLPLLGWTLGFQRVTRTRISEALMQGSALLLIVMYVSGLLGLLQPMGWLLWIGGGGILLYEGLRLPNRRINPVRFFPLGVFIVTSSLYFFSHQNRYFFFWDEFSHWGIFIKEMLGKNQFYGVESNAAHLPYFPGTATWQYLVNFPFEYSESGVYFANFLFLTIPLIILFENIKKHQWYWFFAILLAVFIGVYNFGHGMSNIYVDHLISAWFTGVLIVIFLSRSSYFYGINYVLPLLVVLIIKDVGMLFFCFGLGAYLVLFLQKKQTANGLNNLKFWITRRQTWIFPFVAMICGVLIIYSWKVNRSEQGISDEGQTGTAIILNLLEGKSNFSTEVEQKLSEDYWRILTEQQLSKNQTSWKYNEFSLGIMSHFDEDWRLSTMGFYFLFFVLVLLVILLFKKYRLGVFLLYIELCGIFYLVVLFQTYLVGFGRVDFPSLIRYLHTMILPMFLVGILCFAPVFSFEKIPRKEAQNFLITLGFLLVFLIFEKPYYEPLLSGNQLSDTRKQIQSLAKDIQSRVGDINSRIWVYFPVRENGMLRTMLKYELTPHKVEIVYDPEQVAKNFPKIFESWGKTDVLWFPIKEPKEDPIFAQFFQQVSPSTLYRVSLDGNKLSITPI